MTETYFLYRTDGTLDLTIDEGTVRTAHGLVFDGFLKPSYGDRRNNNLLRLLTNFAVEEDPANPGNPPSSVITDPLTGQLWYNKTPSPLYPNGQLLVWNGTAWVSITQDIFSDTFTGPDANGILILDKNLGADITIANVAQLSRLRDHENGIADNHPAANIVFSPPGAGELQTAVSNVQSVTTAHIVDTVDAHEASAISFVPGGSITSTNTQGALEEIGTDVNNLFADLNSGDVALTNHINDTVGAHPASAISYNNTISGLAGAFDVQAALEELNNTIGNTSNQSIVDSVKVFRSGSQSISGGSDVKVQFNAVAIGDNFNQFNTLLNRYVAGFDQVVRVRLAVGINSINPENRMFVKIKKNGVTERSVEEWKWPEGAAVPGDRECTCLLQLNAGDFIEGFVNRAIAGGSHNIDTAPARTTMEIDIIKALGTPPVLSDVRLSDKTFTNVAGGSAGVQVSSNGVLTGFTTVVPALNPSEWYFAQPVAGIGNGFQARMVPVSGTVSVGTLNTWQTISSNRVWERSAPVSGTNTFVGTLQIRDVATLTIQDQCTITLIANAGSVGK